MSYVEDNLIPGERIEYRARLHRIRYLPAFISLVVAIGFGVVAYMNAQAFWAMIGFAGFFLAVAIVMWVVAAIKLSSSEFAVTNRRVLIKVGIFSPHSLDLLLTKVEGVGVDQTIWGRLLGFGTIIVSGTGGTHEKFDRIADPLEFRRHVQNRATMASDGLAPSTPTAAAAAGPFCVACGAANQEGARFCNKCGKPIPE